MGVKKWMMLCAAILVVACCAFGIRWFGGPTEAFNDRTLEASAEIQDANSEDAELKQMAAVAMEKTEPEAVATESVSAAETMEHEEETSPAMESKVREPSPATSEPATMTETPKPTRATPSAAPAAETMAPEAETVSAGSETTPAKESEMYEQEPIPVTPKPTSEPTPTPPPAEPVTPPTDSKVSSDTHVHEFEKSVWESPTCQMGGYYNNTCKNCGIVECVTEDPLPHEVEDIIVQEGNCMEDTIIRHICKNCGTQVESDTRYTLYDLHTWVTEEVDGNTVTCCADCGVVK